MSLYKQVWVAIIILLLMVFGVTSFINGVSTSRYLEQQLTIKNADDATALALSLSQQKLDPVMLELQLAARIDQGSYEYIEFRDPSGKVIFSRSSNATDELVPAWLEDLFPIYALAGQAKVTNGWKQFGSVSLKTNDSFAYRELWNGGRRTLIALLIAILAGGIAGTLMLRLILNPLKHVVAQAQAIGQRQFLTVAEPFTTEFAEVTRSMNELSRRVKEMLSRESQRLERQREASELDPNTGVLMRDPFMARLRAKLESDGVDANGSVALCRIGNLARLNQTFGRQTMDTMLKEAGAGLKRLTTTNTDWQIGRLNGSDFCLIAAQENNPKLAGEVLQRTLRQVLRHHSLDDKTPLPTACVEYSSGDSIAKVMTSIDGALLAADEQGSSPVNVASKGSESMAPAREQAKVWRSELVKALAENLLFLETYPVRDGSNKLIHSEGMLRIRLGDRTRSAGEFMPWVHRLDMGGDIDRAVLKLAVDHIETNNEPTCANLTITCLTDTSFTPWLEAFLLRHRPAAARLSIEVGEAQAYTHADSFKKLSHRARQLGVKLGVEHMGYRISDIGKLSELGVDYIKVDGLFTRDIQKNAGNSALVRTYASIAQSLGIACIAEGVRTREESAFLLDLGTNGLCGPGVK